MFRRHEWTMTLRAAALITGTIAASIGSAATAGAQDQDARMAWWRDARFGLFIHWGLYAIPAGTWGKDTHHAEWIRTTAKIPLEEYDRLLSKFNPVKFDAGAWVRMAKDAGMRYIVITSKHHDGFALYDSKVSDYDVMATPFKRDILRELADACKKAGIRFCFYHSIMDWHHPDYLPRRGWEKERSSEGADLDRYVEYLHGQVTELLTGYDDIGVMWFDGEWESTWTHAHGEALDDLCRKLKPNIIVNNRVDKGRRGMAGMTVEGFRGDFGTPEQEIPDTGMPGGADWETCMTMNGHWGYNKNDDKWKSTTDLIRKLIDIASKGGNFLLNVGPTAAGEFPDASIARLAAIGEWMRVNGDSIYGTTASPFGAFLWGRCTMKSRPSGQSHLYLHVFERPADGRLRLPGLLSVPTSARVLGRDAAATPKIFVRREGHEVVVQLPSTDGGLPDPHATVIALAFDAPPRVTTAPKLTSDRDAFVDRLEVSFAAGAPGCVLRYTTDGTTPMRSSPVARNAIALTETTTVCARYFEGEEPASAVFRRTFTKCTPRAAIEAGAVTGGLEWHYYKGEWKKLPDFDGLEPLRTGTAEQVDLRPAGRREHFALRFRGYVRIPKAGVYRFTTRSDDGSALDIGGHRVVDNDGLHGPDDASGQIALAAGLHPIVLSYFQGTGGRHFRAFIEPPGEPRRRLGKGDFARPERP